MLLGSDEDQQDGRLLSAQQFNLVRAARREALAGLAEQLLADRQPVFTTSTAFAASKATRITRR